MRNRSVQARQVRMRAAVKYSSQKKGWDTDGQI